MPIDAHSSTWIAVKTLVEPELRASLERLESRGLSLPDTEHERGKIAAYRSIMALASPAPLITSADPQY